MPGESNYPVTPELTAVAVNYSVSGMIADAVMPRTDPLGRKQFKYTKHDLKDGFTPQNTRVGRRSQVPEVEFKGTEETESTEDYGLRDFVPVDDQDQATHEGRPSPLMRSTELVTQLIELGREKRVADMFSKTGNHGSNTALAGTDQWSHSDSDPIKAILEKRDSMVMSNVLILGQTVWTALRQHPKVLKVLYPNNAGDGVATIDQVRDILELDAIYVGKARVNTGKPGKAAAVGRCWGSVAGLIYQENTMARAMGTVWGFTGQYKTREVYSGFDKDRGARGSTEVKVVESVREVVSAKDLGHLWTAVVA